MAALADLKAFNLNDATASLWVFRGPTGPIGQPPSYTGRWVETEDDVDVALKQIVEAERGRIEETIEYGLLAQNNEASALTIATDETHAGLLIAAVGAETDLRRVRKSGDLDNAKFYVIKLVHEDTVIYAIKRTEKGWTTKRSRSVRSLFYVENRLTLDPRPHFEIESTIDFFLVGAEVLILNKGRFESILRYKEAHRDDFVSLQAEPEFAGVFVNLGPLIAHIGENKIQLRRASAIRQKGHYRDAEFMTRLREQHAQFGLSIQFDGEGRIIATPETCAEIITALLDHRLASGFSRRVYDVPSATPVAV
jgi:Kiwa KwaB-like protein